MRTIDLDRGLAQARGHPLSVLLPDHRGLIEACAQAGMKPIVCRQERVGVGIADGYSRVTNGASPGVFAMQFGPGAENAYAGIATAYLGQRSDPAPAARPPPRSPGRGPLFTARAGFRSVVQERRSHHLTRRTPDALRRAYAALRLGRLGPVVVEVPADIALQHVPRASAGVAVDPRSVSGGDPADVLAAARALCAASRPVVLAGQGVLYAQASDAARRPGGAAQPTGGDEPARQERIPRNAPLALGCASQVTSSAAAGISSVKRT